MAEIFLAKTFTSLGTDRLCVIKRILPHLNADQSFCDMLIHEAKLCASLSHANVVQTFDLGHIDGQYYIAMEYVEGFDLNELLGLLSRAKVALSLQFGLYIIICSLRGLDYAHRLTDQNSEPLSIIHRDVSPTNILISTDGDVKLCDFGIAKATFGVLDAGKLDEYHLKGKVAYMAPEHLFGKPVDTRADLYSAGILLWELLSGRRLFKRKDEDQTIALAKAAEIPPLPNRNLPQYEELSAITMRALSKDPDARFQSGREFIHALEDYMHGAGLLVSQLKFADFLMEHFGERLLEQRRGRECSLAEVISEQNDHESPSAQYDFDPDSFSAQFDISEIMGQNELGPLAEQDGYGPMDEPDDLEERSDNDDSLAVAAEALAEEPSDSAISSDFVDRAKQKAVSANRILAAFDVPTEDVIEPPPGSALESSEALSEPGEPPAEPAEVSPSESNDAPPEPAEAFEPDGSDEEMQDDGERESSVQETAPTSTKKTRRSRRRRARKMAGTAEPSNPGQSIPEEQDQAKSNPPPAPSRPNGDTDSHLFRWIALIGGMGVAVATAYFLFFN